MKKDPKIFLQHIMLSMARAESFMGKATLKEFEKNELVQSAVIRQIEIIGEAVKNLPEEFTKEYPKVPWADIAGTRDKMIHYYFGVDLKLTYGIVKNSLPELKKQILELLKK